MKLQTNEGIKFNHGLAQRNEAATNILEPRIDTDSTRIKHLEKN